METTTWDARRRRKFLGELLICMAGRGLFAASINFLITPLNLYSCGFTGIAQLIRIFCIRSLGIQLPAGFDLMGIVYWMLNIPVLFLAWFGIGKDFFWKTTFSAAVTSFFLTIIPVPETPLLDDMLTMCIVGGIMAGYGAGLALRAGGSGGGQDVLGVYFAKKYPNMSVGIFSIIISAGIYTTCLVYFDIRILIYSCLYSIITSLSLDKVHYQNIRVLVEIETNNRAMCDKLACILNRHVCCASESGSDHQLTYRLTLVITKAEEKKMLTLVRSLDPNAFVIMDENIQVSGRFIKPAV